MGIGAWEIKEQHKVMCAILHTELTTVAWAFGLRNLQVPGSMVPVAGMPYDHARNEAVKMFLANGLYQWLFFLDSDVVPPNDAVLRLLSRNLPIVSGMYSRRSPPHGVPVMIREGVGWINSFPRNSLVEADLVGAGCLLIHRHVLEKVPPQDRVHPWFWWRVDDQEAHKKGMGMSEDFTWCKHVRQHGYKIYVDTSIKCRHVGLGQADHGSFLPCEHTPNT